MSAITCIWLFSSDNFPRPAFEHEKVIVDGQGKARDYQKRQMVCHDLAQIYPSASESLKDLCGLQVRLSIRQRFASLLDRRLILVSTVGVISLIAGFISYQGYSQFRLFAMHKQQCQQPINSFHSNANQSTDFGRSVELTKRAIDTYEACSALINGGYQRADVYNDRGQASLVLWRMNLRLAQLPQEKQEGQGLDRAFQNFRKARELSPNNPQASFYMGLVGGLREPQKQNNLYLSAVSDSDSP